MSEKDGVEKVYHVDEHGNMTLGIRAKKAVTVDTQYIIGALDTLGAQTAKVNEMAHQVCGNTITAEMNTALESLMKAMNKVIELGENG